MKLIGAAHDKWVFNRRVRVLASQLAALMPAQGSILDVGCGDGFLDKLIGERRDVQITGIDVLQRPQTHIPVKLFDGRTIPYGDDSMDTVMFVDVLHHTNDPTALLREAGRVARTSIVLKDHTADGWLAKPTLRFMDWFGNAHHGVSLPYNYWRTEQWLMAFESVDLGVAHWSTDLGLYPLPAGWFFDRSLHFIAVLRV